jgi:hypothetical protein
MNWRKINQQWNDDQELREYQKEIGIRTDNLITVLI